MTHPPCEAIDPCALARKEAARLLGSARSPKKAAAARKNGRLGGRPRGMRVSEETRAKQSAAMRAWWARRKAAEA